MLTHLSFRQAAGLFCATAGVLLAPQAAHAQAFTLNFSPAVQTIPTTSSVTFSASITNATSSPLYINSDSLDPLASGLTTDDTLFVNTFLLGSPVLLGAGQTYALTNLFTVTDTTAAPGTYSGQFAVYGGSDTSATNQSGFQTFSVIVPQAVPEASSSTSLVLLLVGGAAVVAARRRKHAAL